MPSHGTCLTALLFLVGAATAHLINQPLLLPMALNSTGADVETDSGLVELELCDCEVALGAPNGLSCGKEGWFISSFQQAGQWLNGGGLVPLSSAICCRPCLPDKLPGPTEQEALAVVSIGCHATSGTSAASIRCEVGGGSFVTGWSEAVRVPDSPSAYYPTGPVDCCTPAVLLGTGEARELERCGCADVDDINCGGQDGGRLLQGYTRWGISQSGEFVPIAPARCCKPCISDRVIPVDTCFDLNFCSGHGVCNLGQCECANGFGGADCAHRVRSGGPALPQWLITIITLASCLTSTVLIIAVYRVFRYFQEHQPEEGSEAGEALAQPLVLRIAEDDEGSVGSEDTTDDDELPPVHPPAEGEGQEVERWAAPATGVETEVAHSAAFEISSRLHSPEHEDEAEDTSAAHQIEHDDSVIANIRRAQAARQEAAQAAAAGKLEGDEIVESPASQDKDGGGISGVDCSVCLNRPVQVVIIPCGHACMCRRCSRRLSRCPVCRTEILRRQRLFVGG